MTEDGGARLRAHARAVLLVEPGIIPDVAVGLRRLATAATSELGMLGATVTLRTDAGTETIAATSDDHDVRLDELEFSHGEGPGMDAVDAGRPVFAPNLASAFGRWPGYAPAAVRAGVCAAYSFPLQLGAARFGVLTLYAEVARTLGSTEMSQCLIFADVATELLLDGSATGPVGLPGPELQEALHIRTEVYQAQGMVAAGLGVSLVEALARMRGHAYADEGDLNRVAAEILAGTLTLADRKD